LALINQNSFFVLVLGVGLQVAYLTGLKYLMRAVILLVWQVLTFLKLQTKNCNTNLLGINGNIDETHIDWTCCNTHQHVPLPEPPMLECPKVHMPIKTQPIQVFWGKIKMR